MQCNMFINNTMSQPRMAEVIRGTILNDIFQFAKIKDYFNRSLQFQSTIYRSRWCLGPYLPKTRAIRAVVPEELSRELASLNA